MAERFSNTAEGAIPPDSALPSVLMALVCTCILVCWGGVGGTDGWEEEEEGEDRRGPGYEVSVRTLLVGAPCLLNGLPSKALQS